MEKALAAYDVANGAARSYIAEATETTFNRDRWEALKWERELRAQSIIGVLRSALIEAGAKKL